MSYLIFTALLLGNVWASDCKPNRFEKAGKQAASGVSDRFKIEKYYQQWDEGEISTLEFTDLMDAITAIRKMKDSEDFEKTLDEVEHKTIVTFPPGKCVYLEPYKCNASPGFDTCFRFVECPKEEKK